MVGLAACCPHPILTTSRNYSGLTSTMYEVVERINANNRPITTLYADHHFRAWIHDGKHPEPHYIDGDGQLLFRKFPNKPDELLLTGENLGVGPVFEIGSTSGPDAKFWVAVIPKMAKEWWGYYKNIGKPCVTEHVPIRPDLVTEVLGIGDIPDDLMEPPAPVMRFINEEDAYVFTWVAPLADRIIAQKEIWYDRATYLPMRVILYDENGRALIKAKLADHALVAGTNGVKIAREFQLEFPESQDILFITLYGPRLNKRGVPKDGTIQMRPIGDEHEIQKIQIDENCP
jgi:hypothetical protein